MPQLLQQFVLRGCLSFSQSRSYFKPGAALRGAPASPALCTRPLPPALRVPVIKSLPCSAVLPPQFSQWFQWSQGSCKLPWGVLCCERKGRRSHAACCRRSWQQHPEKQGGGMHAHSRRKRGAACSCLCGPAAARPQLPVAAAYGHALLWALASSRRHRRGPRQPAHCETTVFAVGGG